MIRNNLRRIRPKEVRLIADILAEPADDVEELAKAVLRALNQYRASEPLFVRAVKDGTATILYGPYPDPISASTDDQSNGTLKSRSYVEAVRYMKVVPLHGPYGQPVVEE